MNIRNFSIVAHIDHGKSTLADRLIERGGMADPRTFRDQMLDELDIERERGITIKSNTITLPYVDLAGRSFELNLIDTPGHVDFTYEVSRALAACEGVLLLIDASQGVEAQTVAHLYSALEHDLEIIPVINKIDLAAADIDRVKEQMGTVLGLRPEDAVLCSALTGEGVGAVLEAVVERIPPPFEDVDDALTALVFDAHYDTYRGTIVSCRVVAGEVRAGDAIRLMHNGSTYKVEEVGRFRLKREPMESLRAGEVGYMLAGLKTIGDVRIGDTITRVDRPASVPLPGFREVKPVVFSSIYPLDPSDYPSLAEALEKYALNDASLTYEKDSSSALGQGFRCGFLGLLHLEIVNERLEREFGQILIMTMPSVRYRFTLKNGDSLLVDNPRRFPAQNAILQADEPSIRATIMVPQRYMGAVVTLCQDRRGVNPEFECPSPERVEIKFDMPLAEVLFDFFDKLKSLTQGYGSFDYEMTGYQESDLVKLDILVNGQPVDALATMLHRSRARRRALQICERLRTEIPRQLFRVAIQGAIGSNVIARSNVAAFRKDVTSKCYGGDVTRKRKLLERQRKGKARMRTVGKVQIPQSAFVAALRAGGDD